MIPKKKFARKRKVLPSHSQQEKKVKTETIPKDTQEQIKCFCETLHRVSFPSLVELAKSVLHLSEQEAVTLGKKKLCDQFEEHLTPQLLPLATQFNILEELKKPEIDPVELDTSQHEICRPLLKPRVPSHPSLSLLVDPLSTDLITDFLQIGSREEKREQPLVNFSSLLKLRGRIQPFTGQTLTPQQMQFFVNRRIRNALLKKLEKEWGYKYEPVRFSLTPSRIHQVKQAWNKRQQYYPIATTLASVGNLEAGSHIYNPIDVEETERGTSRQTPIVL